MLLGAPLALDPVARLPARIDNPDEARLASLEERLLAGEALVIQFVAPTYGSSVLARVDALCARFPEQLEIRFYGHDGGAFDARTLLALPHVVHLSVDCLRQAENTEALGELPRLRRLSLGIEELPDYQVLRFSNLRALRTLAVTGAQGKGLNLSHLEGMRELEELLVGGHERGLSAIRGLPKLWKLRLSVGKKVELAFLSDMPLRWLTLSLGGRDSLAEVAPPTLEALEIIRVKGLSELGPLARFPALRLLSVEDQPRLLRVDLSDVDAPLERLRLINCKGLSSLDGLARLSRLKLLCVIDSALSPEALLALALPPSLATCVFATPRETESRRLQEALEARGYRSA